MGIATAKLTGARISTLKTVLLLNKIRNKSLSYAKNFLKNLIEGKTSINGKYYTKTAKVLLSFLESAEANAKQKNLNLEKLFIKTITANKGEKIIRPRSRWRLRGRKAKSTNLHLVLEER
jgi:large subunit ribosomal protein L22